MSEIITCPSGLSGRIRGMKVREERVLADRRLAKSGGQVDELLAACWEETLDAGPYDFGEKPIDWGVVLQGDRFFALLQIRALTYGPTYTFAVNCQSEACRARIEWELDLAELPCRALSEESRAALLAGNRFETTLPDADKRVWFRLLTGADERKLPQLRRNAGDQLLSAMLAFRVLEVEGVEARDKKKFIEDLSLRDADYLVDEFDRVDCGVDTGIEIECPECFATQEVDLPFDRTFFMPGKGEGGTSPGPHELFPGVDLDGWREGIFQMCWRQHGGSGLGASLPAVLAMTTADRDWFLERIGQQRSREAKEIEKAGKRRS